MGIVGSVIKVVAVRVSIPQIYSTPVIYLLDTLVHVCPLCYNVGNCIRISNESFKKARILIVFVQNPLPI